MARERILPGAAGLIALTATIGFIDGYSEIKSDSFSRSTITLVSTAQRTTANSGLLNHPLYLESGTPAYLVKIMHGDTSAEVLINADTGQILVS